MRRREPFLLPWLRGEERPCWEERLPGYVEGGIPAYPPWYLGYMHPLYTHHGTPSWVHLRTHQGGHPGYRRHAESRIPAVEHAVVERTVSDGVVTVGCVTVTRFTVGGEEEACCEESYP